jgi:hypothetical protein
MNGYRVVTDGLKPAEKIVINGLQRARPGMKVAPTPGPMLADSGGGDQTSGPPRDPQTPPRWTPSGNAHAATP